MVTFFEKIFRLCRFVEVYAFFFGVEGSAPCGVFFLVFVAVRKRAGPPRVCFVFGPPQATFVPFFKMRF